MPVERYPAEVPISASHALAGLYDYVDLRPAKLEAVLPTLDLDFNDLSSTHIHLGHKALLSLSGRMTQGQCIKVFLSPSEKEEQVRAEYVDYLMPGFPKEKIPNTTFVAIDLPGITIETFLRAHGLIEGPPIPRSSKNSEPDMFDLEQAICHSASKVLIHELLHVPKPMKADIPEDEHDTHRENEETFIESRLSEIGEEGVPTRLVNVRLSRSFTMASLSTALQTIQDYRKQPSLS
jgi:hypothetical protein